MSKDDKILERLLSKPKNFTYAELKRVLSGLGYTEIQKGKTSGSRVAFINMSDGHIIRLHKPHPNNELKQYQINQIIDELRSRGIV